MRCTACHRKFESSLARCSKCGAANPKYDSNAEFKHRLAAGAFGAAVGAGLAVATGISAPVVAAAYGFFIVGSKIGSKK
ncbi:hypothetical protein KAI87_10475 [Myxococcota bacterium]|nr:hypothetical protein [Myxococcota bacterium]